MVRPDDSSVACVDEDTALDFVQGHLVAAQVARIDEHADRCATCRALIDEAVKAFRERSTEPGLQPTPVTRFTPGATLAGRYRILRFIARGGMGEVYEAEDLILNTRLALKTLAATISDDPQAIRRLKLEVNLARRITHPNVCRIFDLGVHEQPGGRPGEGVLFITMELIDGESLGHRLRTRGSFAPGDAKPVALAMIGALGAAHRAGVVHRDFKSDNVMLAPGEPGQPPRVVVMDFGLARASSAALSTTLSGESRQVVGTLGYMAPEQLQGRATLPGTDVYALGVVMFEMLTGQLPFSGESPFEVASRRLVEDAPSPRKLVAGLDRVWESTILRCLAREPEQRYANVDEVATALAGAREVSGAASITTIRPVVGRRKAAVTTALAAGVVVAAAASWFLLLGPRAETRSPAVERADGVQPEGETNARTAAGAAVRPSETAAVTGAAREPTGAAANPATTGSEPQAPGANPATGSPQATRAVSGTAAAASTPTTVAAEPAQVKPAAARHVVRPKRTATRDARITPPAADSPTGPAPEESTKRARSTDPDDGFILP